MSQATDHLAPQSADNHPFVVVLRLIAGAAPNPWFPYRTEGLRREALDEVLEVLWVQELIQKVPTTREQGPALRLTALGERVLSEPELLDRLVHGQAIDPNSPAAVVRANLSNPPRVWVCKVILAVNIAVFLWGLNLASKAGAGSEFFWGFSMRIGGPAWQTLRTMGSLAGDDLLRGEWWRLIASGFNHIGALDLAMNMYGLYAIGWFIEQRWGWWRFLIIYFMSIWTGGCLAMAYQPNALTAGASGGLCGVFAAFIGWLILYGKYLPASGRRRAWQNVTINVMLLAMISFMLRNQVSHWGHGGGALGGFASCFVLHLQRFGPVVVRLAATALLFLLPVGGWFTLKKAMATQPIWQAMEKGIDRQQEAKPEKADEATAFRKDFTRPVSEVVARTMMICKKHLNPLLNQHPSRWDAEKVKTAIAALGKQEEKVQKTQEMLSSLKSDDKDIALAREKGLEALRAGAKLLEVSLRYVRLGKKAKRADDKKVVDHFGKADDAEYEWKQQLKKMSKKDKNER